MKCRYCSNLYLGESIKLSKDAYARICPIVNKQVVADDSACDSFQKLVYFPCMKLDFWTTKLICMNRQIKQFNNYKDCKKCRQFQKEIKFLPQERKIRRRNQKMKLKYIKLIKKRNQNINYKYYPKIKRRK
jgi:hypothetical protein